MASVADAVISLGVAPNSQLNQQVNGVVKQINNVLTAGLATLANVIAPAIGVALAGVTRGFALEIEKVGIAADRLNMPVEQMDAWAGAANMAGVSTEQFISTLDSLHNQMVSAARFEGGGLLKEMMRGYMPQVGDMDAVENYLLAVSDAVSGISKVEAHRELGKIGINDPKLQRWLMQGSSALRAQIDLSRKLGVITEEDRMIADRMNFAMRAMSRAFERSLLPIFRLLAPAMEQVSYALLYLKEHWQVFVPALVFGAGKIAIAITKMLASFTLGHPILTAIITLLGALGVVFEDLMVWMEGGNNKWGKFWESIFGSPAQLAGLIGSIKAAWDMLTDPTSDFTLEDFFGFVGQQLGFVFGDKIDEIVKYIKDIDWKSIFASIADTLAAVFKSVYEFAKAVFESIDWQEVFETLLYTLESIFEGLVYVVTNTFNKIDWKGIWQNLKDTFNSIDWKGMFQKLAMFILNAFKVVYQNIKEIVKSVDWKEVFSTIFAALITIFEGAFDILTEMIKNIDWSGLWKDFNDAFDSFGTIGTIAKYIVMFLALRSVVGSIVGIFSKLSNLTLFSKTSKGSITFFGGLGSLAKKTFNSVFGVFIKFFNGVSKGFTTVFSIGKSALGVLMHPIKTLSNIFATGVLKVLYFKDALMSLCQTGYLKLLYFKDAIVSMCQTGYLKFLYFKDVIVDFGKTIKSLGPKLASLGPQIVALGAKIWAAMAPLLPLIAILGLVAGAGYLAFKNQDEIVANTLKGLSENELDIDNDYGSDVSTDGYKNFWGSEAGKKSMVDNSSIVVNVGEVKSEEDAQRVANEVTKAKKSASYTNSMD